MSLLIDALKRAEQAKRAHSEPQLTQPNIIERAVEAEARPLDWTLSETATDPVVGEGAPDVTEISSRTEPKFSNAAAEPTPGAKVAVAPATKSSVGSGKFDSQRIAKEREAAQALFQAKRPMPRSRAGILLAIGLAALLLAGGGFYVWYSLAFPPSPPAQPMQARISAPPVQAIPAQSVARNEPVATPEPVPQSVQAAPEPQATARAEATTKAEPVANPPISKAASIAAKRARLRGSHASTAQVDATDISSEEIVRREIEQVQRMREPAVRRATKDERGINVSRGERSGHDFDPDLALAYSSLLSGQRAEAKRLYSIVAERDPFNVDALLGLATIAANQGDLEGADRYYRRGLELEPQNAAALAGLASIRQPGGATESQIKSELARSPDSPQLHFALGNHMANQGRWDEAQQAYFNAFSLDARNPDFAYNLAVGLDQLGQIKQATIYYRKALELAAKQNPKFRLADVRARLVELASTP